MTRHKIQGIPYDTEMLYLLQEGRQMEHPSDRIAFFRDVLAKGDDDEANDAVWKIAEKDMDGMAAYEVGAITLEELCKRIAKNNFLDRYFKNGIPKEMMLNEMKMIGWGSEWKD